jgi:SAM-dependent methyltransferase
MARSATDRRCGPPWIRAKAAFAKLDLANTAFARYQPQDQSRGRVRRSLRRVTDPLPVDWEAFRRDTDLGAYEHWWEQLEAAGVDPHGEVALVQRYAPRTVLDAGCGTGRVAIELARRGVAVVGVDRDADMVEIARAKAPELGWVVADLAELALPDRFDVVVLAGNVVPYIAPDRRAAAVTTCARHLHPGGVLVAGFALRPDWPDLAAYDHWCTAAGLALADRWAAWDHRPYEGGDYAVFAHKRVETSP